VHSILNPRVPRLLPSLDQRLGVFFVAPQSFTSSSDELALSSAQIDRSYERSVASAVTRTPQTQQLNTVATIATVLYSSNKRICRACLLPGVRVQQARLQHCLPASPTQTATCPAGPSRTQPYVRNGTQPDAAGPKGHSRTQPDAAGHSTQILVESYFTSG